MKASSQRRKREAPAPKPRAAKKPARKKAVQLDQKRALALKLTTVARQMWLKFDQSVEKRGLTRAKWIVIAAVAHSPGMTQRTIASALHVTEVTAGRLIDRLCADGFLERRDNPEDRRSYRVHVTAAAQPVLDQLGEIANVHAHETFAGFVKEDLAKLDALLEAMGRNIGQSRGQ